ncbi:calcitonin gene-related peptide 2-like isoform X3 [Peromyscus eremicus]|uniref:calcitonin gene-related peptide 2-like isoform X3 n=1 Tax=Peromyscus eremicus TaxID=42410 RepID=UPI0027DE30AA|nr:calcitonin gene-related peptide 2-like isoform X3 [Peromyscus eremicus]
MRTPHPQDQRIRDQDSGDSRVVCALLQWKLRSRSANARVTSGPFFSFYRDTMGFWKFFTFLALSSVWILCLASNLQAAPLGSALESSLDLATLSEQEKRLLLAALVQNYYELMKARKLEQEEQETESSRCCLCAPCLETDQPWSGFSTPQGKACFDLHPP